MFLRAMNVMQFGFFLYAHREGIKVWNVAMVFAFNAILTWINLDGDVSTVLDFGGRIEVPRHHYVGDSSHGQLKR